MFEYRLFAEVILPLPLPMNYSYAVPQELEEIVKPGMRVEIQFGQKKIYSGLVKSISEKRPEATVRIKPLLNVLDSKPILFEHQFKLWDWMSDYYLCYEGDVMNSALPSAMKLESKTSFILQKDFNASFENLNDKEFLIAEALTLQHELTLEQIQKIVNQTAVQKIIASLIEKNVLVLKETLQQKAKPKVESFVQLNPIYNSDDELKKLFDELERKAPQQLQWLLGWFQLVNREQIHPTEIKKSDLRLKSNGSDSAFASLVKKNIFFVEEKITNRLIDSDPDLIHEFDLSEAQQTALTEIKKQFEKQQTVLLHGVTGSGKTNIYIKLIEEILASGKQVLYLLPEIALTTQITSRLQKVFGKQLGIYHSKFNNQERIEIWNKVLNQDYNLILGARSALLLPYRNIGLIIVDEEHDASYKQYDPAPRYHARDAAIYYAGLFGAKTLLGTATPSMESFYNCKSGKYGLVKLNERFGGLQLPEMELADMQSEKKEHKMHGHFTEQLMNEIKQVLEKKEQVILFQNRRGFAPFTECKQCGWTPECPNCDVQLIYHKHLDELKCHYCNYRHANYKRCPACNSAEIFIDGFGTEKLEDELPLYIPGVKVARMDVDAVKTKNSHNKLIQEFEEQKIQVLVGTQMVTKGLDFDHVSLVGIMSADQLINHSDFRAGERAYQLMEQVKGRAGRKNKQGKVIIQTMNTKYAVLQYLNNNDFIGFYENEIEQRQKFLYPPFTRMIKIELKHKQKSTVAEAAKWMSDELKSFLGNRLLGPAEPSISKIKNLFLMDMILKLEKNQPLILRTKNQLRFLQEQMKLNAKFRSVFVEVDVDPY